MNELDNGCEEMLCSAEPLFRCWIYHNDKACVLQQKISTMFEIEHFCQV